MFHLLLEWFTGYCSCNLEEWIFLLRELLIYTDIVSAHGLRFTLLMIQDSHLSKVYCELCYRIILRGVNGKIFKTWCLAVTSGRDTEVKYLKCTCLLIFPSMGKKNKQKPYISGWGNESSLRKKKITERCDKKLEKLRNFSCFEAREVDCSSSLTLRIIWYIQFRHTAAQGILLAQP